MGTDTDGRIVSPPPVLVWWDYGKTHSHYSHCYSFSLFLSFPSFLLPSFSPSLLLFVLIADNLHKLNTLIMRGYDIYSA